MALQITLMLLLAAACALAIRANRRLRNLRANCFVTNEHGHRVRYANATDAVRVRVEGGAA